MVATSRVHSICLTRRVSGKFRQHYGNYALAACRWPGAWQEAPMSPRRPNPLLVAHEPRERTPASTPQYTLDGFTCMDLGSCYIHLSATGACEAKAPRGHMRMLPQAYVKIEWAVGHRKCVNQLRPWSSRSRDGDCPRRWVSSPYDRFLRSRGCVQQNSSPLMIGLQPFPFSGMVGWGR